MVMIRTLNAPGKTPRADLHLESSLYRSRPEEGISDILSEYSTRSSVIPREPRLLIGLIDRDLLEVEDDVWVSDEVLGDRREGFHL